MFDTVNFRLLKSRAGNVDFLAETACYLEGVCEHSFDSGVVLTGQLNGLKISISDYQLKIKGGSLCKWYFGDNYQTLGRGDTERALEKLSDTLHIPMSKAAVTRLDIAQNFITRHPPEVYLNHLGALRYYKRLPMADVGSLYYSGSAGRLCFYDKNREQRGSRESIPELYRDRNVLRYEQRYMSRITAQFKAEEVTGAMLYDRKFYATLLNRWRDTYKSIQKINDVSLNFEEMKSRQQFYMMGVIALAEKAGGQMEMYRQIKEAQNMGILTRKQAYEIRNTVKRAFDIREGLTVENEAIKELNKKVDEAVKFYR